MAGVSIFKFSDALLLSHFNVECLITFCFKSCVIISPYDNKVNCAISFARNKDIG